MSFNSPYGNTGASKPEQPDSQQGGFPPEQNTPTPYGVPNYGNVPQSNFPQPPNPNSYDVNGVPAYGSNPVVQQTGKNSSLSIVGLILAIVMPLVGAIISGIAWKKAIEDGDNTTLPKVGLILGIVFMILNVIFTVLLFAGIAAGMDSTGTATIGTSGY